MGVIVDTSVLIAAERGAFDLDGFLTAAGDAPVGIAAITASELLHGVERSRDAKTRLLRERFVEALLSDWPVFPFGIDAARLHARIWASQAAKGRVIGAHDLQVAATAMLLGSAVATLNQRDFKRVARLDLAPVTPFVREK